MNIEWIKNDEEKLLDLIQKYRDEGFIRDFPCGLLLKTKDDKVALVGTLNQNRGICDCCLNHDIFDKKYYTHFSTSLIFELKDLVLE